MRRPPDDICKRIHDLWARASDPSNEHESAFARTKLRELQIELGLSNFMLTYIIEREQKAPSKLEPSQIEFDPIEIMLDLFELARIKLTPEQEIVTAVWVGHSYVFHHYRHTPRLLLRSREGGCGKTALMSLIEVTAANALKLDDVSAAVIYNYLSDNPGTTFLIDNGERNPALWSGEQLLLNIYEHGHRERGRVSRLINRQPVFYPCFAPLALAYIERDVQLSSEALERSTIIDMVKNREGRDEFDYGHPLIPAFRVGAHGFAETFKRPKNVSLPKELDCRFLDNWRVLIEIGTVLGYPRTIGAAAIAVQGTAENVVDVLLHHIRRVFDQKKVDEMWTRDLLPELHQLWEGWSAFCGIDGRKDPHKLTARELNKMLWVKHIIPTTVWRYIDGERRSNNGFRRKQFQHLWGAESEDTRTQSNNIRYLTQHKESTGYTQD